MRIWQTLLTWIMLRTRASFSLPNMALQFQDLPLKNSVPAITRDELVYRKELRLMDEFKVDFESVGNSQDGVRFRVRNTFRNSLNEVLATVTSEGVWLDLEARRPRPPPPDLDSLMRDLRRSDDYNEIPARNSPGTTT